MNNNEDFDTCLIKIISTDKNKTNCLTASKLLYNLLTINFKINQLKNTIVKFAEEIQISKQNKEIFLKSHKKGKRPEINLANLANSEVEVKF